MTDFARYQCLHRVQTTIRLVTPYLKLGIKVSLRALLEEFRSSPSAALHAAAGHSGGNTSPALLEAIDQAHFEAMTSDEISLVAGDVRLCLRLYYGEQSRMWRDCSD